MLLGPKRFLKGARNFDDFSGPLLLAWARHALQMIASAPVEPPSVPGLAALIGHALSESIRIVGIIQHEAS